MPNQKRKKSSSNDASLSESEISDSSPSKKVHIHLSEVVAEIQKSSPLKRRNQARTAEAVQGPSSPKEAHLQTGEESSLPKMFRSKETRVPKAGGRSETESLDVFKTPDPKSKTKSWPEG